MKHSKVGTVMTSDVVSVERNTPFKRVAGLLATHDISGLPVVDDDMKVVGVISETDLMLRQAQTDTRPAWWRRIRRANRTAVAKAAALTAAELMTVPPVTVRADDTIARSARVMAARRVERLPVLDEEARLVGIVTRRDLLRVFLRPDADIRDDVIREVVVRALWLAPMAVGVRVEDGVVTLEGRVERTSEVQIAEHMTAQIDGVVAVTNHLTARFDDRDLQPAPTTVHGVVDGRLRRH